MRLSTFRPWQIVIALAVCSVIFALFLLNNLDERRSTQNDASLAASADVEPKLPGIDLSGGYVCPSKF